jgi:signal transduction histidine kinase/DNA-binding response OmpR family regulator
MPFQMKTLPGEPLLLQPPPFVRETRSILVVEDNTGDFVFIRELLGSTGVEFALRHATDLSKAGSLCEEYVFDIVLLDLGLPDSVGIASLKKFLSIGLLTPVVVMTGMDDDVTALEALRNGAQDYLVKSRLTADNLIRAINYAVERKKIQDLLEKNARQFSLLSQTTAAFNECEDNRQILDMTCRQINLLLHDAGVISVDLNNPEFAHTAGLEGFTVTNTGISDLIGLHRHQSDWKISPQTDEIQKLFYDGMLHQTKYQITASDRENDMTGVSKMSGTSIHSIYAIGFIRKEEVLGFAFIISYRAIQEDDATIIETICSRLAQSLHRRNVENDLKTSENRYRELSMVLDIKVRERTRELENLNYQLKQELIERQVAEDALRRSEAQLKDLNTTKDKIFNIIAHDLKNPFTCILGATELLSDQSLRMDAGKIQDLVKILNQSAQSGYEILQNLLDWSRTQTGLINFKPECIDLKKLIDDNISILRLSSLDKEITLFSEVQESFPVVSDKNMLNSIIRNLLGNALKFTNRYGTIIVSAVNNGSETLVKVKDTGIGIPAEKIPDLFRIESRFTRPGTKMERGTGLGLKICKDFVEIQGGCIRVKSEVNKGSEFIFSIPHHHNPVITQSV